MRVKTINYSSILEMKLGEAIGKVSIKKINLIYSFHANNLIGISMIFHQFLQHFICSFIETNLHSLPSIYLSTGIRQHFSVENKNISS